MKMTEQEKGFKKHILQNVNMWIKAIGVEGNIDDVIRFTDFLSMDAQNIQYRELHSSKFYGKGVLDTINDYKDKTELLKKLIK